jgi:general stress protein YciG
MRASKGFNMNNDSPQKKGGLARSEKLSQEERREIARKGGLARGQSRQATDLSAVPWAVAEGKLKIGDKIGKPPIGEPFPM